MKINIDNLTIEEKIGQMIGLAFAGTEFSEELRIQTEEFKAGLFIFFKDNCVSPRQIFELNQKINEHCEIPPFIGLDQEGGMVARVTTGIVQSPGAMAISAGSKPEEAFKMAYMMGSELKLLGFNTNFAPEADVNNNPLNPVINVRSYSEDPHIVTEYMAQAVKGYDTAGLLTTIKHFPGHGDTAVDSHLGLPTVNYDKERLNEIELVPFKYAVKHNFPGIMASHILYSDIDNEFPTTMSRKVIQGLLRDEMGYDGLVITDSLTMKAVWGRYSIEEIVYRSFNSGCDIMLLCGARDIKMQKEFYETAVRLAKDGKIDMKMINNSVCRIIKYKQFYTFKMLPSFEYIENQINLKERVEYAQKIADRSVTLLRNELDLLPLKKEDKILFVIPKIKVVTLVENDDNTLNSIADYLDFKVDKLYIDLEPTEEDCKNLLNKEKDYEKIVFCSYNATFIKKQEELINSLDLNKLIVLALRTPYDYNVVNAKVYLTAYEASVQSYIALSKFLVGKIDAMGKCPVTLKNK